MVCQQLLDPETYNWDPLDADLLHRLNIRRYVSLSREKRLNIPIEPLPTSPYELNIQDSQWLGERQESESSKLFLDYVRIQNDPANSFANHASIFDADTPGALTLDEVERDIPLGEWKLRIRGAIVQLEVCEYDASRTNCI